MPGRSGKGKLQWKGEIINSRRRVFSLIWAPSLVGKEGRSNGGTRGSTEIAFGVFILLPVFIYI